MAIYKQHESFPGRTFYKSTGRIDWARFFPWLLAAFAVAIVLAWALFRLFLAGYYFMIFVPALAALAVAGMMRLAVVKGLCRNPLAGAAAGVAAGLLLYLGYFYFGMVYHMGREAAGRPDLLPRYIRLRMETDVIQDTRSPDRDDERPRGRSGSVFFNWMFFAFESVVVLAITTLPAFQRSRKPFCESCRRWMVREVTHFEPGRATELTEALRAGSARSLSALCAQPAFATVPNLMLAAELCPAANEGGSRDCPVYISLKNVTKVGGGSPTADPFDSTVGKVILRSLQLNPNEIAALGSRFKAFETLAGRAAVTALAPEPAREAAAVPPGTFADIEPVEPEYAGQVLAPRAVRMATARTFGALLGLVAALVLAAWGGITVFPKNNSPQPVPPGRKILGIAAMTVGLICFGGGAIFLMANPMYFSQRYQLQRARLEFSRRPKCLVDPNDPEALFVEIVPKLNWGKMMLETASDVGFLRIDPRRKEILFEGDRQRFRIPAEAITYCAVETYVEGQGTAAATRVSYLVLRARHPTEFWEAPLRERGGTGIFGSGKRQAAAQRLFQSIQQLRPADPTTWERRHPAGS